jgi:hypothetical protein
MSVTTSNEVQEDFLEVDQKIPGQNYACMSFVSPDKLLKQKEIYNTTKFLEHLINGEDQYTMDFKEKMMNVEKKVDYNTVKTFYDDWRYSRVEKLEQEFYELNDFHTTMRGLKIRGVYDTHKEATVRAQVLRRKDPSFNVFVGQVGYWLPWDPECEQVQEQEYQETMLNDLVKKYKENLENRDDMYEQVKEDQLKKAREENRLKKEELAKQNIEVKEETTEDKKKIEELREIVDESDRLFYEHNKKMEAQKKNATAGETTEEVVVTDDTKEVSSENKQELNGFTSENMTNLESADPWMKNKEAVSTEPAEASESDAVASGSDAVAETKE